MMARSTTRSNQRPDTLMQDRICQVDETSCNARPDHTLGSITSFWGEADNFRSTPMNEHILSRSACLKVHTNRLMHRSNRHRYSITSSARARSAAEMSIPRALAALMLITSSILCGCSTGRSAGRAPLSILSTYVAAR